MPLQLGDPRRTFNAGRFRYRVTLEDAEIDGTPTTYDPAVVPMALEPDAPGPTDNAPRVLSGLCRFHPQITTATRLRYTDATGAERRAVVRGVNDAYGDGRMLALYVEEVDG